MTAVDGRSRPRQGGSRDSSEEVDTTVPVFVAPEVLRAVAELVLAAGERVEQAELLGRAEGLRDGVAGGYAQGYRDGFEVGRDIGAAHVLIHGPIPDLSPEYAAWRSRLEAAPECARRCGRCSACVRLDWLDRHGEFLGVDSVTEVAGYEVELPVLSRPTDISGHSQERIA